MISAGILAGPRRLASPRTVTLTAVSAVAAVGLLGTTARAQVSLGAVAGVATARSFSVGISKSVTLTAVAATGAVRATTPTINAPTSVTLVKAAGIGAVAPLGTSAPVSVALVAAAATASAGALSPSVPGVGTTLTYVNTAGLPSPSVTPVPAIQWFARGAVPSGSIAVPQLSGADCIYNVGYLTRWDDGSLQKAHFYTLDGSFVGGGSHQFTYAVRAGAYTNTSAITLATVTAETDLRLNLRNTHNAFIRMSSSYNVVVSVRMGGGAITGGTVFYPPAWTTASTTLTAPLTPSATTVQVASVSAISTNEYWGVGSEALLVTGIAGTTLTVTRAQLGTAAASHSASDPLRLLFDVRYGNGTGGSVYANAGSIVVFSAGAGYAPVGSGTFSNSVNGAVATLNSSGNNNGVAVTQYAKGPACDAWRLRYPTSGLPHHHVTWYVERWKRPDGTLLDYFVDSVAGNGLDDPTNPIYTITYDADLANSSTVIRGSSLGTLGWTNQVQFSVASWGLFDSVGRGFWLSNDSAFKAIEQRRTPTECDQLKATGIVNWLNLTPTITVPTTPTAFENSTNGGRSFLCTYQPMGSAGVRAPAGSGGSGNTENPMGSEINATHWQSLRSGTAGASTWLQNSRVGAAHALGSCGMGGSLFDKTNLLYPCTVPTSAATFAGMTQSASVYSGTRLDERGIAHPIIDASGELLVNGANTYHQTCYQIYPYIIEGRPWMIDAISDTAATCLYGTNPTSRRQVSLGPVTYYAVNANNPGNIRVQAWWNRTLGYTAFAPRSHPDGSTSTEPLYLAYALKSQFDYKNALVSFLGTVTFGTGGASYLKSTDFTGSGCWPENFYPGESNEITVPFMDDYEMMVDAVVGFLWRGTAAGASVIAFRDYFKIYYVRLWAYAGSHYLNDSFRINALAGVPPALPSDITWASMGDEANPRLAIYASNAGPARASFTAASATIALGAPLLFQGSTRVATGSRVKLTNTNLDGYGPTAGSLPPEISASTYYYYKELTSTTCELYTDAGLTALVTPSTSVSNKYLWVVPANALPADSSGAGTYNGGTNTGGDSRIGVKLGTLRLCALQGMLDDANGNVTAAITNTALIFNSIAGQPGYAASPQYGWGP